MSWITVDDLKEYIGTTGTAKDSLLEATLDASEHEILNFCHRSSEWSGFESSTGTRYYRAEDLVDLPYGPQYSVPGASLSQSRKSWDTWGGYSAINAHTVLWLGADLQSVDELLNGTSTAISSTSYWVEPRNQKPYKYIRLKSDCSWTFDTDGEIAVAGTWCFSTAPDPTLKHIAKEMAKYLLDTRASQVYDVTAMPEIGQIVIPKGVPAHVAKALKDGGYVRSIRIV